MRLPHFFILFLISVFCSAQQKQQNFDKFKKQRQANYDQYRKSKIKEFDDYKTKRNQEFADYLQNYWTKFDEFKGIAYPKRLEPVKPVYKREDDHSSPSEIIVTDVSSPSDPLPFPEFDLANEGNLFSNITYQLAFYNTEIFVMMEEELNLNLADISEKVISEKWSYLSNHKYKNMVSYCLLWKEEMKLCDWGYVQLVRSVATVLVGASGKREKESEVALLQTYILTQSGYDAKVIRKGDKLVAALAMSSIIYEINYITIDNTNYYLLDASKEEEPVYTFKEKFSENSRSCYLEITQIPDLEKDMSPPMVYTSERYPFIQIPIAVNYNLITFYNNYPFCDWVVYAATPMSDELKTDILPVFQNYIRNKTLLEATEMVLNFVQTAFKYQTDHEQFGYERTFFADELFFYPASDCEDRAILFSQLIKELLNLEVVLLHYPNHLATAIHFPGRDIEGDYVMVDNKKYIVCDPTYINASVGEAMPKFKGISAKVIKI